jgi:hypothetical protein
MDNGQLTIAWGLVGLFGLFGLFGAVWIVWVIWGCLDCLGYLGLFGLFEVFGVLGFDGFVALGASLLVIVFGGAGSACPFRSFGMGEWRVCFPKLSPPKQSAIAWVIACKG